MADTRSTKNEAGGRASTKGRTWSRTPPPEHTPSTQEWVEIARRALIDGGIVAVKIDRLAKIAGVTRGGFYWRFKSHAELLGALLADWRVRNTQPMLDVLAQPGNINERLSRLANLYISEDGFSPAFDRSVRAWANLDPNVEKLVQEVDEIRIAAIRQVFFEDGYDLQESMIRARVTYFHQIGYYTTGIQESIERRRDLSDAYVRVFTGRD